MVSNERRRFSHTSPRRSSIQRNEISVNGKDEKDTIEEASTVPWLTLIDREIGSVPDPTLILQKEIGSLNFDMTTIGLDIQAVLKTDITSYLRIEEKIACSTKDFHQLPWESYCSFFLTADFPVPL